MSGGLKDYYKINRIPVVLTERGSYSSYHYIENGLLGERVTDETCTHYLIHTFHIEKKDD